MHLINIVQDNVIITINKQITHNLENVFGLFPEEKEKSVTMLQPKIERNKPINKLFTDDSILQAKTTCIMTHHARCCLTDKNHYLFQGSYYCIMCVCVYVRMLWAIFA